MTSCISELNLLIAEETGAGALLQDERRAALADLLGNSHFQPRNDNCGPYALQISIEEGRLLLRMRNARHEELSMLVLSLKPYRRMIQDYFLMLESYDSARHHATREKLEAIDMARRALHNEGAELLIARMEDKIDMDFETARRLFTLICVLHRNNIRLLG
ncbi:MAG TPA: UPF0262 family protein [Alphaproteobacteria bacterium]|jgi:uncharacterized protein (UPF0262 family)